MSSFRTRFVAPLLLMSCVFPLAGCVMRPVEAPSAVPPPGDWASLERLEPTSVAVTLSSGERVSGRLKRATEAGLSVNVDESIPLPERFLPRDLVVRVAHVGNREVRRRAGIGALFGLGLGISLTVLGGPGLSFTLLTDPAPCAGIGALSSLPARREVVLYQRRP